MRAAAVWWRWLSSLVINDSFVHLAAGALLFGSLGLHLERRYGTRRIAVLALICGIAGNFFDTTIMVCCITAQQQVFEVLLDMHSWWRCHTEVERSL
jgi:membrane associated rhomboid family serine protease